MSDREKLIELIDGALEHASKQCEELDSCCACPHGDRGGCQSAFILDYLIANGVTFATDTNAGSKWISVEDRLPEPCVSVLTLRRRLEDGACSQRVDSTIPIYDGTFVWFSDTHSWKTKVTHWMPLPEAPKED